MRDVKSVNVNAYSLSNMHLDKQVKQVNDLLDIGVMRSKAKVKIKSQDSES